MAEALYLVTKSRLGGGETFIDGVNAVVINQDTTASTAQRLAAAAAAAAVATGSDFPDTYFDAEVKISTSDEVGDPGDALVILPDQGAAKVKVEG